MRRRQRIGKTSISSNAVYYITACHVVRSMRRLYAFEWQNVFGSRMSNTFKAAAGSRRRKRISLDVSLRVGSHTDTNSEGDADHSGKKGRQTQCGTSSSSCRLDANPKFVPKQTSYVKLKNKKTSVHFATLKVCHLKHSELAEHVQNFEG